MNNVETLLIINSALLGLIGILFGVVGFFVRDLHRDFKTLAAKVNELGKDHHAHLTGTKLIRELLENQVAGLARRVAKLESKRDKK